MAVVAAPAEILLIDLADVLDILPLLIVELPTILKDLPVLIEKVFMLGTRKDRNTWLGKYIFKGESCVIDDPPGKRLHSDAPYVFPDGLGDNPFSRQRLKEAKTDHDRLEKSVIENVIQYVQAVAGYANMPNQTFFLCPHQTVKRAT